MLYHESYVCSCVFELILALLIQELYILVLYFHILVISILFLPYFEYFLAILIVAINCVCVVLIYESL